MINEPAQEELVDQILKACENNDLSQVKSFRLKVNLKSIYHSKNQTARKVFKHACFSGNIDIVDELLYLTIGEKSRKPILNDTFKDLILNNNPNNYPLLSYLVNTPKLEPYRNDDFYEILENGVEKAAKADNLPLVKALMNLEDTTVDHNYIFSVQYLAVINNACHNNNIEVFKYIYDYRQSKDDKEPDYGFWKACITKNTNILKFLIFGKNIERNEDVEENMKLYDCVEARNMFDARDLNRELPSNNTITKKNKI